MDRIKLSNVIVPRLEELGLPIRDVLRRARLPQTLFSQDRIFVTTHQFFSFWNAIGEMSDDPAIGLKIGSDGRVEQSHPVIIAALTARSFREALVKLARYKRLCASEDVRITEENGKTTIEFVWLLASETEPPLLLDGSFAAMVALGQRGTGRAIFPEMVEFNRAESERSMYELHFGCPAHFGSRRNALTYSTELIDLPFITHNPDLLAMLAPQLEEALRDYSAEQSLSEQVKAIQRRMLAGQRAGVQDVAAELNMSPRTLQRRLAEAGVKYQELLDGVRREMAQKYLGEPSLDLSEISYLLGYEEANSFHRAFQHWMGVSPGQWRAMQG